MTSHLLFTLSRTLLKSYGSYILYTRVSENWGTPDITWCCAEILKPILNDDLGVLKFGYTFS